MASNLLSKTVAIEKKIGIFQSPATLEKAIGKFTPKTYFY
jgi:hypothetical protein